MQMAIVRVRNDQAPEPAPGLWSNCLVVNGIAYLSGLTGRDTEGRPISGGEYAQAKLIFERIAALLKSAGGSIHDVVKLTIFVTDITQREHVWRARKEVFVGDFPACSLVQVAALAEPAIKVEIEAVAHIGASQTK
jgi:enamine deaminase RidA (YjgF/YER057c/UK114 family)